MTDRTFKQFGQAYGSTPATITVTLDGTEIYSGPVSTLDEPFPTFPDAGTSYGVEIFSWTESVVYEGTKELSISVSGSPLLLADTLANYTGTIDPSTGNAVTSGATGYVPFHNETIEGVSYAIPFSYETLDGVSVSRPIDPDLPGQYYYTIPVGSTFTCTVNMTPAGWSPTP